MKRGTMLMFLAAVSLLLSPTAGAQPAALDAASLARGARPSVMLLTIYDAKGNEIDKGTGFLVSADGRLITSWHLIEKARSVVAESDSGKKFPATGVLLEDPKHDLAVLKIEGRALPYLTFDTGERIMPGARVIVVGSSRAQEEVLLEGKISAVRQLPGFDQRLVQITPRITAGATGSPVLGEGGQVLGVALGITRDGESLNFAVPAEEAKTALDRADQAGATHEFGTLKISVNDAFWADSGVLVAYVYLQTGEYAKAMKGLRDVAQRHPDEAMAHLLLALVCKDLKNWDEALASCRQAVKLNPDYALTWFCLGYTLGETDKWDEAIVAYEKAFRLNPDCAESWRRLGYPYSIGRAIPWEEAARHYGEICTVEGTVLDTHNTGQVSFLSFQGNRNIKTTFVAAINFNDLGKFATNLEKQYLNKKVRIWGQMRESEGRPEIVLKTPSQIQVISEPPARLADFFDAISKDNVGVVRAGLNVNSRWANASWYAEGTGDKDAWSTYLRPVVRKKMSKWTAIHCAAYSGNLAMAQILIERGADVNEPDDSGITPLQEAVRKDHADIAELLISKGARPRVQDLDGWTPLHWAVYAGSEACVNLLIAKGVDVNAKEARGFTPLHFALVAPADSPNAKRIADILRANKAKE